MSIQNIVVLMLENRSFDHLLGSLNTLIPGVAGLSGKEFNYDDPRNPQSTKTVVTPGPQYATPYSIPFNPQHEFLDVQMQLYGPQPAANPAQPAAPNAPTSDPDATPMNGFMFSANASASRTRIISSGDPQQVMEFFVPEEIPVLTTLAQSFAVFNWWFSSLPGPTWPNRYFIHAATSGGLNRQPAPRCRRVRPVWGSAFLLPAAPSTIASPPPANGCRFIYTTAFPSLPVSPALFSRVHQSTRQELPRNDQEFPG